MGNARQQSGDLGGSFAQWIVFYLAFVILALPTATKAESRDPVAKRYTLNIPASDIEIALFALARETDKSLVVPSERIHTTRSHALNGTCTLSEALAIMLEGTNLTGDLTQSGVITISARKGQQNAGKTMSPGKKIATSVFAFIASAFAAPPGAQADSPKQEALETIIVTAQKRSENLQNVPREIQAFSANDLQQAGVKDPQSLQLITPGLIFGNQSSTQRVYIRGIGTLLAGNGLDPAVASYYDDRYESNAQGGLGLDFLDVARVEVLKGPQGTLFGRNAAAGAVSVISNDVGRDFGGYIGATAGNYSAWTLQGAVNIPITSNLGIRLAALTTKRSGFDQNLYPGGDHTANDKDLQEFRGRVHWDVNDRITSDLILSYWEKDDQDGNATVVPAGALPFAVVSNPPLNGPPFNAVFSTSHGHFGSDIRGATNAGHDFAGEWKFNVKAEPFDIISITTGSIYKHGTTTDADASSLPFFDVIAGYQSVQDFSQEIRLVSNNDDSKLKWLGGLYYYRANDVYESWLNLGGTFQNTGLQTLNTDAVAAYGNATYSFTEQWALQIGGRWSREDKGVVFRVPASPLSTTNADRRWYSFTPELSLQFRPGFGLFYFTYSQGFKSGGYNFPFVATTNIGPEHLASYVAGYKADLADGRVRLDFAAFKYNYANMQVTHASTVTSQPLTENAASSTINGLELNATWVPVNWLNVTAGGSWTNGHYDKFTGAQGISSAPAFPSTTFDASGRRLLFLSKWTYFVQLATDLPISNVGKLHSEVTWSWKSDFDFDFAITKTPQTSWLTQRNYGLLSARLTYTPPNDKWEVAMWGNNLLNKDYYTIAITNAGFAAAQFAAPRTFGADLTYKF